MTTTIFKKFGKTTIRELIKINGNDRVYKLNIPVKKIQTVYDEKGKRIEKSIEVL